MLRIIKEYYIKYSSKLEEYKKLAEKIEIEITQTEKEREYREYREIIGKLNEELGKPINTLDIREIKARIADYKYLTRKYKHQKFIKKSNKSKLLSNIFNYFLNYKVLLEYYKKIIKEKKKELPRSASTRSDSTGGPATPYLNFLRKKLAENP